MSKINIFLLDSSNNIKEETNISRPKSYHKLLNKLNKNIKNIPEYFEIFIVDKDKKEVKINVRQL